MKNIDKHVVREWLSDVNWHLQQLALASIGLAGFLIFAYDVKLWFSEMVAAPDNVVISGSGLGQAIIAFLAGLSACIYHAHRKNERLKRDGKDDNV